MANLRVSDETAFMDSCACNEASRLSLQTPDVKVVEATLPESAGSDSPALAKIKFNCAAGARRLATQTPRTRCFKT